MTARQFVGLALLLSPGLVIAQVPAERGLTPVRSIREQLYEPGIAMTLLRTLRQMDQPVSRERLDALADSLVAFVLTTEADDRNVEAVMSAVTALGLSGMPTDVGVPYDGAGDRLFQIVSGAHSAERKPSSYVAQESAALYAISQLSDRQKALALLERSVTLDRPAAGAAVGHLDELMGAEGRATLRRLYESGQIRDRDAIERAEVVARRHNFRAMRDTSPEVAIAQIAAFRRLSPASRVALALEASDWLMAVARARASAVPAKPESAESAAADHHGAPRSMVDLGGAPLCCSSEGLVAE